MADVDWRERDVADARRALDRALWWAEHPWAGVVPYPGVDRHPWLASVPEHEWRRHYMVSQVQVRATMLLEALDSRDAGEFVQRHAHVTASCAVCRHQVEAAARAAV